MDSPNRQLRTPAAPHTAWSTARRVLAAAALVALLLLRFSAANDHAHLFEAGSNESCAACLLGTGPVEGAVPVVVLSVPFEARADGGPVAVEAPHVGRIAWLPFACGPPAQAASSSTS